MERALFESLSLSGLAPKLYYQNKKIRIEEFFESKTLSIFEMRNPVFMEAFAEKICDFHYCKRSSEVVSKFLPKGKL